MKQNPYNVLRQQGVPGGRITSIPANYDFELTMDTWWSAVQRARLYSDFTGLDALYNYIMKSNSIVRSAIEKRLRPLKARTFGVYINGKEDERLTKSLKDSELVRYLIYQVGLSNFTFARVIGVNKDLSTYHYPLRNLDIVNRAVKKTTYNFEGDINVDNHYNLFWIQTSYDTEDTLGLLEPIARDVINMIGSQNNWQTASQFAAYQQMVMFYEDGDEKMENAATQAAKDVGLGSVLIMPKTYDYENKQDIKGMWLENVAGSGAADMFRIFKENIEMQRAAIMQLVIGSSLLGLSDKNTNSERLVRAHLRLYHDILESDATDVQDWFNRDINKKKLALLLDEPTLINATFRVKPQDYIDVGDVDVYTKFIKDGGLSPTDNLVTKIGLEPGDVKSGKETDNASTRGPVNRAVRAAKDAARNWKDMAVDFAERVFQRNRPSDGEEMET